MTIYDIAKEANVSISTVSRVLNTPERVSAATRKKVKAVLDKYNYIPNTSAQALVNRSAKTIGILVPDIRNLHFSSAAYYLETLFFDLGYSTLLCNTGNDSDMSKKTESIRVLASKRIDALIMLGSVFSNVEIEKIVSTYLPDVPIITSNAFLSSANCYSVEIDHNVGMNLAVSHLADRGFEELFFVQGNQSVNTLRKVHAFSEALETYHFPADPQTHIRHCEHGPIGGCEFAKQIAQNFQPNRRVAYIFMDDYTAIGAVNYLRKFDIHIPRQVGIVGHDNSVFALCSNPQLTTIDTKIEVISQVMVNSLQNIFKGIPTGNMISVRPELIVRETT